MSTAITDNNAVREHAVRKELFVDGYEVVIGIEIHCQLNTESKIFSSAPTDFGHEPNSQASIVDLGLPGVLPVLNAGVVDRALKFGIGVNASWDYLTHLTVKTTFTLICLKAIKSPRWQTLSLAKAISMSWSMKGIRTNIPNVWASPARI